MNIKFMNISKVIRDERMRTRYSQEEVSCLIGYKKSQFISNIERGLCSLPFSRIKGLSTVLNCSTDLLKDAIMLDISNDIDSIIDGSP